MLFSIELLSCICIVIFVIVQCDRTQSLSSFFTAVAEASPAVLGVLGCGCSVATEPVAEIIHHWNISQVIRTTSL